MLRVASHPSEALSSVEEAIEEFRNGRMVILVDYEEREMKASSLFRRSWQRPRQSISWPSLGAA